MLKNLSNKKYPIWAEILLAVLIPIIILTIWQIGASLGFINMYVLSSPSAILKILAGDFSSGKLWKNLSVSFTRVMIGYAAGVLSGIILGFLMGLIPVVNKAFSSITSLCRAIPTIALVPLFILLFGIRETSKRVIIGYASFWPVLLNTMGGIQSIDYKLCEVAYTYRIPKYKVLLKIYFPSALPSLLTGIRLGITSAWMAVIAAEMFAASRGIGYLITTARDNALVGQMFAYVIVIGIIGLTIDKILIRIQNFIIKKTRGLAK